MLNSRIPAVQIVYGGVPMQAVFQLTYNSAATYQLIQLEFLQAETRPVLVKAEVVVETAFNNGATLQLNSVDASSNSTTLLATGATTLGTVGFYPAAANVGKLMYEVSNTYTINAVTANAPTAGACKILLTVTPFPLIN